MRTGAFKAYANSKAPNRPVNLKRDFGIYLYIDKFYITKRFCKRTAKSLTR